MMYFLNSSSIFRCTKSRPSTSPRKSLSITLKHFLFQFVLFLWTKESVNLIIVAQSEVDVREDPLFRVHLLVDVIRSSCHVFRGWFLRSTVRLGGKREESKPDSAEKLLHISA